MPLAIGTGNGDHYVVSVIFRLSFVDKPRILISGRWTKLRFMRCGRRGPRSRRNPISTGYFFARAPLRQPREMAEWVEFLEKYAHLDHLEAPFGGGGSLV